MAIFDVAVIGGGVIGAFVLRNLARYKLDAVMLEKESDVCMGQSKANSGIVHAGFDAAEGSLKAKFNVEGAAMMPAIACELGVKYKNNGSLVKPKVSIGWRSFPPKNLKNWNRTFRTMRKARCLPAAEELSARTNSL